MPDKHHDVHFPGESDSYRASRNRLLEAELQLRKQQEAVTKLRSELPLGGAIKEDYVFEEIVDGVSQQRRLSELFEDGKNTLVIYSYMYDADQELPCPMCTSMLDGLNGQAHHITQRVNLVVVGKSPALRLQAWADKRGWRNLRMLSSNKTTYNADYHGESDAGDQWPACNVFTKTADGVFHYYSTEVLYVKQEGQPRHVDHIWPLWNLLDMTPEGRGEDWHPNLSYE